MAIIALIAVSLFPMNEKIMYAITVPESSEYAAKISTPQTTGGDEENYHDIASVFVSAFVEAIERYDYAILQYDMLFINKNATDVIYNKYNDSLRIENPNSPVLKFKNNAKRVIEIRDVKIISTSSAKVKFNAAIQREVGVLDDKSEWEADVEFSMDKINTNAENGAPFAFTVTSYKPKLIKNNNVTK
ncbi:MAG: VirB8/TrbF family protein [Rickettsiaceae bacterium]|nr:VirB8/TrbF family protein [Rickettsiaceae bacterium]